MGTRTGLTMTKQVRIENVDIFSYKVSVEVWNVGVNGTPDSLERVVPLDHPTALAQEYIHSGRYLIIREKA